MELRELRSRDAGYARELKERADEIEELNQVQFKQRSCTCVSPPLGWWLYGLGWTKYLHYPSPRLYYPSFQGMYAHRVCVSFSVDLLCERPLRSARTWIMFFD